MNGSSDIVQPSPAHPTGAITTSTAALTRYYRWHAQLYDATRWSFLFGRAELIRAIAGHHSPSNLLEVGCGTGTNLSRLGNQFPKAALTGLDLSEDMLTRARRKTSRRDISVTLLQGCYDRPLGSEPAFDLIVFSYCLSMINPGWEQALDAALRDLRPGGLLGVVDFHDTRLAGFQRWMAFNHVRMESHLLPHLNACCHPVVQTLRTAYGGGWRYFLFIGRKQEQ